MINHDVYHNCGCVMDCHATNRGSIPGGDCVKSKLQGQGTVNGGAVSKWPRCQWDAKHNQLTNQNIIRLMSINEEQIITCYPIDGAMGLSGGGWVQKLSDVCLHNNVIVGRGILVTNIEFWDIRNASAPSILLVLLEPHCKFSWAGRLEQHR